MSGILGLNGELIAENSTLGLGIQESISAEFRSSLDSQG